MKRTVVALLVGFLLGGGVVYGTTHPGASRPASKVDVVSIYNDGWTDSKQDDCDQSSVFACSWLKG